MEIFPNSEVKVLKRAPVDKTNYHTILFSSAAQQYNTFSAYAVKNFSVLTYQRYDSGVINVQAQMSEIYDCNYLMFRNSSFENKWFYAFIDDVEYVNNVTARIYYTIDVIQTWMFDLTLGDSFVVREHSETDNPGDNLVDEKIPVGEYEFGTPTWFSVGDATVSDMCVVILVRNNIWSQMLELIPDLVPYAKTAGMYSGVYQGCMFVTIPVSPRHPDFIANVEKLYKIASNVDFLTSGGIISVFMCPEIFVPVSNENSPSIAGKYMNRRFFIDVEPVNKLVNYTPRNKKLLTYPYNCLNVTIGGNQMQDYAYEYFNKGSAKSMTLETCFSATPSMMVFPSNYLGTSQYLQGAVCYDNFPTCAWGFTELTEWINNDMFKTFANGAMLGLSATAGMPMLPPATPPTPEPIPGRYLNGDDIDAINRRNESAANQYAHTVAHMDARRARYEENLVRDLAALTTLSGKPTPRVNGGARGGVLFGNASGNEPYVWQKSILPHEAAQIDSYFDRFGYATNTIKIPNIRTRPGWNYVRTTEAKILGTAPAKVEEEFRRIHDRGITYWHNPSRFMDYTQSNAPIAVG